MIMQICFVFINSKIDKIVMRVPIVKLIQRIIIIIIIIIKYCVPLKRILVTVTAVLRLNSKLNLNLSCDSSDGQEWHAPFQQNNYLPLLHKVRLMCRVVQTI